MKRKLEFVSYEEAVRTNVSRLSAIRKHGARMHALKVALLTLGVFLLGGATVALGWFGHISSSMNNSDVINDDLTSVLSTDPKAQAGDPFYMLLLGVDRSDERKESAEYGESDSNYRSDSMMVVRVAPNDKKVTLVSLHRDTAIDFGDDYGVMKLNASYALGGAPLAVKTVSEFADVPIQHYAEIDFDGLVAIVDALGGVEVDVPMDVVDPVYTHADIKKGKQVVNGEQALQLCRARHAFDEIGDGDLYRAANQRMVLAAIAKKALSSDPATLASTVTALASCVRTDLGVDQLIGLLLNFQGIDPSTDIMSGFEPTESCYVNETWYEVCDKEAWQMMMTRVGLGLSPWSDASQDVTQGAAGMKDLIVNGDDEDIVVTSKAGANALTEDELEAYYGRSSKKKASTYYYDDDDEDDYSSSRQTYEDYSGYSYGSESYDDQGYQETTDDGGDSGSADTGGTDQGGSADAGGSSEQDAPSSSEPAAPEATSDSASSSDEPEGDPSL